MTTLSTHDTKRSEDVRARLAVLAELPTEWAALVRGCWPGTRCADRPLAHLRLAEPGRRLAAVARAGARLRGEGGPRGRRRRRRGPSRTRSSRASCTPWSTPRSTTRRRRAEIDAFVARIAPLGWSNSLSQKLLQLTMPGVPDVYQGTELWDFSLVDPDNRRPVDYAAAPEAAGRARRAARCRPSTRPARRSCSSSPGCCGPRRDHPEWFAGYEPVQVTGLGGRPRGGVRPRRRRRRGHPAAGRRWPRAAGATPRSSCPTARGATCSPASGSSPPRPGSRRRPARPPARGPARPRLSDESHTRARRP